MGSITFTTLFFVLILILLLIITPLFLTLLSKRSKGTSKIGWLILVLFTSWIGYCAFLIVTTRDGSAK